MVLCLNLGGSQLPVHNKIKMQSTERLRSMEAAGTGKDNAANQLRLEIAGAAKKHDELQRRLDDTSRLLQQASTP